MSSSTSEFFVRMIVFMVAAWVVYAADRKFGRVWYRKWYDFSHEQPLPAETVRGFVCGRSGRSHCTKSLLLSLVVVVGMASLGQHDTSTLTWIFTWMFGVVVTLSGFITGPLVVKIWNRREKVFETVDHLQDGHINPGQSVQKVGRDLRSRLLSIPGWFRGILSSPPPKAPVVVVPESSSSSQPVVGGDPLMVSQFVVPSSIQSGDNSAVVSSAGPAPAETKELTYQEKIDKFTHGSSVHHSQSPSSPGGV